MPMSKIYYENWSVDRIEASVWRKMDGIRLVDRTRYKDVLTRVKENRAMQCNPEEVRKQDVTYYEQNLDNLGESWRKKNRRRKENLKMADDVKRGVHKNTKV